MNSITQPYSNQNDDRARIQQSLQDMAVQLGEPITSDTAKQLYQAASDLLSHVDCAPITLARVAGTLLVYQLQHAPEELEWYRDQIKAAAGAEEVEELIESISRTDAL